ncbi:MAG: DNA-processing protein DprA [Candidatus Phosphoribacter sp.]|nr:DNA-protecting protein DprA [Actinomycetales bacterium]
MSAELSPGTERWARAAWTRVAEPDDPTAHDLIGRLSAGEALGAVLRGESWVPEALRLRVRGVDLDAMVRFATRQGWRLLIPGDPDWPTGLDQLAHPPVGLWVHGPADLAEVEAGAAAVVGSRACTAYGLGMAHDLGAGLSSRGYVVVSGAAFGIDRAAHEGCLSVHGTTVAVLAGGLDRPYPAGNADLIAGIARVGALVSEVAPGGAPTKSRFLKRNRLIATMTTGTVVVEAGLRSGSLNTATQAAEHGRPVGAVPGQVTSRASAGCHQAIRDGKAVLVTDVAEVLDLLGRMGLDAAPRPSGPTRPEDELPPQDREVLAVVPVRAASTVNAIAAHAGVTVAQAQASLARLEVVGAVVRVGDSWQQRPRRTGHH